VIAALVAALALGAADPCAPVQPAVAADPRTARTYREVADFEAAAGSRDTAILAYRSAAALDPADHASRAALERYCLAGPAARKDPFKAGLAKMDAGDLRGAIADFRAARGHADEASVALLEGICHYELGELREAEPLLREAERSPEQADLAQFYLGLLALRQGATARAASLFDAASTSPAIGPAASDLARLARTRGPWALTFLAATGFDSNVNLAPPGSAPARVSDGLYALALTGVLRPWGSLGPYVRGQAYLDQQFRLDAYDVGGGDVAAGWQHDGTAWSGLAEYDYAYQRFGGSPFLSAHRLLGSAWTLLGGVTLGATYYARFESYADGFSPFSGTLQAAEVRTSFAIGGRTRLSLAYGAARDAARESILSYLEHGPRIDLRYATARGVRLGADVAATFRGYDIYDPTLGAQRRDTYLDAAALVEWDLSYRWTTHVALRARRALSNVAGFEYTKVVPTIGVAYTFSP
jgi:tetratricopeptide (TPR) repeat protein